MDSSRDEFKRFAVAHEGDLMCLDCNLESAGEGGNLAELIEQAEKHNQERHSQPS